MEESEVRVGMRVSVPVFGDHARLGRVEAGPYIQHVTCRKVWLVRFRSGAKSNLTANELDHPDPITRLADLA